MNRVLSLLTLSVLASALPAQITDPIAGSEQLTLLPPVATGSEGEIHYTVDFKSRTGRTYVLEETNELSLTKWRRFPVLLFGNEIPVSPPAESPSGTPPEPPRPLVFTNSYDSGQEIFAPIAPVFWPPAMDSAEPRQFFRLRYVDGLLDPLWGDYDRDGVNNNDEVTSPAATDPFAYPDEDITDSDSDKLPDAWERYRLGTLDYGATDTNAAHQTYADLYALERRDNDSVPDGLPDDWELFRFGNLNQTGTSENLALFREDRVKLTAHRYGAQIFKYDPNHPNNAFGTDPTTPPKVYLLGSSGGSMIVTYTSTNFADISEIRVWPSNRKYGTPDVADEYDPPDLAIHYAHYTSDLVNSVRHYTFTPVPATGDYVARDLLRTLDGRPLERFLNQAGAPRLRSSPLAITSLPLTHVGPDAFPIILRDFPYYSPVFPEFGQFKHAGLAAYPDRMALTDGLISSQQDGGPLVGLPRLAPAFYTEYPEDTGNRFAAWFNHPDAFGFNLSPQFNDRLAFDEETLPHKNDVGLYRAESTNSHAFSAELHLRVNNLSSESTLNVNSDDDLWVFINGQLVHDGGGRHLSDYYDTSISLAPFWETPNSSCQVDIFYAERQTSGALLRLTPNNATLHPIYAYQVVAEADLPTTLSYSLTQSPIGMVIDARTGRILWDYTNPAHNITSDNYNVTVSVADSRGYTATQSFTITLDL